MENIKDTLKELISLGLVDEDLVNDPDLSEWIQEDTQELVDFWIHRDGEEIIDADTLLKMPFNQAMRTVQTISMKNRLDVLTEIDKLRTHYYNALGNYGEGVARDEQLSPEEFRSLLGKIKHIEIVQNWLYGIG